MLMNLCSYSDANKDSGVLIAPEPLDLCFAPCKVTEDIPYGLDFLAQRLEPMLMGDNTPPPLPNSLLRIQRGRRGRLRHQHEAPLGFLSRRVHGVAAMLLGPIRDDQQRLPAILSPQLAQQGGAIPFAQCRAKGIVGATGVPKPAGA